VTRSRILRCTGQAMRSASLALLAALPLALAGCMRGGVSHDPPVHLVLDMDFQPKLRAQGAASFEGWADGRAQRLPVSDPTSMDPVVRPLVVARDSLPDQKLAHRAANGVDFVKTNPLPLEHKFTVLGRQVSVIDRGRDRYDIHCAICHGYTGQGGIGATGHGLAGRRWNVAVPNFHLVPGQDPRVPNMPDGEIFEAITSGNGKTMPAYGARLSVEDRWAIVHYVRALQSLSR
jgi:mono/diheme cytochrome c family protein